MARFRDGRCAGQDLQDRLPIGPGQGHKDARHEGEMKVHVKLVAVPQVGAHILGPLVGFGEEQAARGNLIHKGPQALQIVVRLGQILTVGAFSLVEIGDSVDAKAVHADVQPMAHHLQHLLLDFGVVIIQVRLVVEKAVPVVGSSQGIPRPV